MFGRTFLIRKAKALDSSLTSVFNNEIGLQLLNNVLSLSFLSMSVIIACLCEVDRKPESNASFKDLTKLSPRRYQNF